MKLKKIASVALAGVMAVSVLAGCANKPTTGNNEGEGQVETTVTVADVLNQAQTGDVKVDFTMSDSLNTALQTVIAAKGTGFAASDLTGAVEDLLDIKTSTVNFGVFQNSTGDLKGLLNDRMNYYYEHNTKCKEQDGATFTAVGYKTFTGYADQAAALKAMGKEMDTVLADLAANSAKTWNTEYTGKDEDVPDADKLQHGKENRDTYYKYSYTGNVALITINNTDGTTSYGLFYVINQAVAEATI